MAQEITRIEKEFIFKTLVDTKALISVHTNRIRLKGHVITSGQSGLKIDVESVPEIDKISTVSLFFSFRGNPMTCKCEVFSLKGRELLVKPPDAVYRDLSRGYERISAQKEMHVSLVIQGEKLNLDFPASEGYFEPGQPDLDTSFDASKISELLKGFREKAGSFASENKIVMFRERRPETAVERLLGHAGKILLLPFEDLGAIAKTRQKLATNMINEEDVYRVFRNAGEDPMMAVNEIQAHLLKLKNQRVWHEMYSPVLFREYVVGYIFCMRSDLQTSPFSPASVEFCHQFAKLLSYSLHRNGYFKTLPVKEGYEKSDLVDVSGSGLLFSYNMDGPTVQLYMDVELKISWAKKEIPVKGRVMRRYRDAGRIYVGVQFMEIEESDRQELLEYIYGGIYTGDVDEKGLDFEEEDSDIDDFLS